MWTEAAQKRHCSALLSVSPVDGSNKLYCLSDWYFNVFEYFILTFLPNLMQLLLNLEDFDKLYETFSTADRHF